MAKLSEKEPVRLIPQTELFSDFSMTKSISKRVILEDVPTGLRAYLEISSPGCEESVITLDESSLLLGRSSTCRVQIQLPDVSRVHARLTCRKEEYLIEDLESTNGIFVNGVRVQKCVLKDHDQIQIGDAKILYVEERIRQNR
jgi:pSer/pThr/pTyr-binding forkhead associated (FHA) protein